MIILNGDGPDSLKIFRTVPKFFPNLLTRVGATDSPSLRGLPVIGSNGSIQTRVSPKTGLSVAPCP